MKKHFNNPDSCTACTVCVAHCPVTAATREFRGPKMVGPALERMRLSQEDMEPSLEYCSNCKNCDMSCPSGVPISTLNMLARAKYYKTRPQRLRDNILSHGEKAAKLVSVLPFGALFANLGMSMSGIVMKQIGISDKMPMPKYASSTFMDRFKSFKQTSYADKVVFYPGCFINYNDPEVGMDFVKVMQANKFEVIVEENFVCCGSPLVVNGYLEEAEENAKKNISILKKWADKNIPVITCCTSCGLMLKQEYQELFHVEDSQAYAHVMYDAAEFLLELEGKGRMNTNFKPLQEKYIYHSPCHLRAQGMGLPGLELLGLIPGLSVQNADAGCCGISGNYGFKDDKYDIAMKVGSALFQKIKESGLDTAVSECGTCRLQIGHGAKVKTLHPMTLVRRAYEGK